MAQVQKHFEAFHKAIRLDEENEVLREKRDVLVAKIHKYLKANGRPSVTEFMQGGYAMGVGTIRLAGQEHDIDVGLRFDFTEDDYSAADPRKWIYEAVKDHTKKEAERKGPCIRVIYADGYHVDLVVYAAWEDVLGRQQFRLAHKTRGWVEADPPALLEHVRGAREPFKGTEDSATKTDQLRRMVRYYKRWTDERMPGESDNKPTGLALVLLAIQNLSPRLDLAGQSDDRRALRDVAQAAAQVAGRIIVQKPTPEYEDVFSRISDSSMNKWKAWFQELADALEQAEAEPDPVVACERIQEVLGDDFPVPSPEDTGAKTSGPAIITSSSSA